MKKTPRKPTATRSAAAATSSRRRAGVIDPMRVLARDVMKTDVLVLGTEDPIKEAAERLEDLHISGAPVVNAAGRVVGVLTLSDIARSEHVSDEAGVSTRFGGRSAESLEDMVDEPDEDEEVFPVDDYDTQVLGGLRVADWMSPGVIQVAPDDTLAHVCRRLLDEEIHRVFVMDQGKLVGVLSTEDVVRLVANAAPVAAAR